MAASSSFVPIEPDRAECCVVYNNAGVPTIWNAVRDVQWSAWSMAVKFWDYDVNPPLDITADVISFRHAGRCECCRDSTLPPPPVSFFPAYSAGLLGGVTNPAQDKYIDCAPISWSVTVYVGSNVPVASAGPSPVLPDLASAAAWINSQVTNTYFQVLVTGPARADWSIGMPLTPEVLVVVTETADPACAGQPALMYAFTNIQQPVFQGVGPFYSLIDYSITIDWNNRASFGWISL